MGKVAEKNLFDWRAKKGAMGDIVSVVGGIHCYSTSGHAKSWECSTKNASWKRTEAKGGNNALGKCLGASGSASVCLGNLNCTEMCNHIVIGSPVWMASRRSNGGSEFPSPTYTAPAIRDPYNTHQTANRACFQDMRCQKLRREK